MGPKNQINHFLDFPASASAILKDGGRQKNVTISLNYITLSSNVDDIGYLGE